MPTEMVILKLEGTVQASQVAGLAGQTFTVGKVTSTGTGIHKWLFLNPVPGSDSTAVALKIEGTQQIAKISALSGKTVVVGKSPVVIGGLHNLLVLHPAGAAATPAVAATMPAAKVAANSQMVMLKLDGTAQAGQIPILTGKTFTVVDPPIMGAQAQKWLFLKPTAASGLADQGLIALKVQHGGTTTMPHLVGKTVLLGKSPMIAGGAGKWIMLSPVATGGTASGVTPLTVAHTQPALGPAQSTPVMQTVAATKTTTTLSPVDVAANSTAATSATAVAAKSAGATAIAVGSTSLGLSLAAWGAALLITAAVGVGVYNYMSRKKALAQQQDQDMEEALAEDATAELSLEGA
ncbi:MAG: hypothetical protein HQL65_08260 [Magnetococcales bacterium]|nr:hypothetical protein [Magnetococcales bacterium]